MKKRIAAALTAALLLLNAAGCGTPSEQAMTPLIGLNWFAGYDAVKTDMAAYTLLDERESGEDTRMQRMQDYTGLELFDVDCDLTLCFTESGLIGLNYHDIAKHLGYRDWQGKLESAYGIPTEEGSGMASWYADPLGKNTAVYLFNLEEGVQLSFYATANTPDQSYAREGDAVIPTPEIRTPIVPVREDPKPQSTDADSTDTAAAVSTPATVRQGTEHRILHGTRPLLPPQTDLTAEPVQSGTETTAAVSVTEALTQGTASAEEPETTVISAETEPPPDLREAYRLSGLSFYGSPAEERQKMSAYTQLYEYRTEEAGQPWELITEYAGVPFFGKNCDAVLCFTSLGLVSVNFFDADKAHFSDWTAQFTEVYGAPDELQNDYAAWSSAPVGSGTMICIFALGDGVQISFFADDTGSEPA